MIQQVIAKLVNKEDLARVEARTAMSEIMSGEATLAQIAAFLAALRLKGETVDEITGCAEAMREKATRVRTKHPVVVDTCGTGGDAVGTFNVSTAAALVACGAGAVVAKHGNRAVSSRCGSADVLKALGVKIDDVPLQKVEQCLDEVGIGKIVRIIEKGVIVELPLGVDGFIPASQLSMTPVKNFADSFHVGDALPLKVIDFDKDSKKIVLSVVEYLRGKEQKLVDEYVSQHKLAPMTIKDVANVSAQEQKPATIEKGTTESPRGPEKPADLPLTPQQ